MEHLDIDDGFGVSFVVATARQEAWSRLVAREGWMPAFESPIEVIASEEGHELRARKAAFPHEGSEIVVTLEDASSGCRITVTQTGFGRLNDSTRAWLTTGWLAIVYDFVTLFHRGVVPGRHLNPWADIGCELDERDLGLVVTNVRADTFAARAGLQVDDVIVRLAGSPVISIRDVSILTRGPLSPGAKADVVVLRGAELVTATDVI